MIWKATSFLRVACTLALFLVPSGCGHSRWPRAASPSSGTETIVILRHGEKAEGGKGQLSCKGLNRALALPRVLIGRFGHADAIFAPNPAVEMKESALAMTKYSYVRPLVTIDPTAIALGLPVNTQYGFRDIRELEQAVTAPEHANSTIFIAWEHKYAYSFAQDLLEAYGQHQSQVLPWPSDDYETMYVFHITQAAGSQPNLTFGVQQEGLSGSLSDTCPGM